MPRIDSPNQGPKHPKGGEMKKNDRPSRTSKYSRVCIALFLATVCLTRSIYAVPGVLDTTFGTNGKISTPSTNFSTSFAYSVATQPDGKVVLAGGVYYQNESGSDFLIARYNNDGTLDASFGGSGRVVTQIGATGYESAASIAIQSDGKIVAVGYTTRSKYDFAIVRYNSDGTLDTTFGGTGKVITSVSDLDDGATSVAIQSDGRIVVAGYTFNGSNSTAFALLRYNPDGSLDTSFDSRYTLPMGSYDFAQSVAIQHDGKIVCVGNTGGPNSSDFLVMRYNTTGSLDTSFSGTGRVTTPISGNSYDFAASVAIQVDGKIVSAGGARGTDYDFAVVRYNTDGTLDTSFNGTGKVVTSVGSFGDRASGVAIQTDGSIIAVGRSSNGTNHDFAIVRYFANGAPDTTFGGGNGKATVDFGSTFDVANSVVIDSQGRAVLAGESDGRFAAARFILEVTPPAPSINGRVLTSDGRPLRNAMVTLIPTADPMGPKRRVTTTSLGFFTFDGLTLGESYSITVASKMFRFDVRTVRVDSSIDLPDFIGFE
jgi:uncharacterized delta-60 repeat protein